MTWICAQIGAREHYAIPRALSQNTRLDTLYTDFWAGPITRAMIGKWKWGVFSSLAARFHPALTGAHVNSWNIRSLLWESALHQASKKGGSRGHFDGFVKVGRKFSFAVRDSLRQRRDLPQDAVFFAYDTGALEAFEWAREHGIRCVLNQMDPNRVELDLVRAEARRWPGWELHPLEVPEEYFQRREQEWALADMVVVNSTFCKQALIRQGVAPEKLFVLPLSYEAEGESLEHGARNSPLPTLRSPLSAPSSHPLRVLFLGQVILRKGIQYLMEAARWLENENIRFDVVGPIGISEYAMASAPKNLKFHGRANRADAKNWYQQADVFVLPTLSDGFAITQIEAMARGLPVVTTPCCGEVVSDGVDGFVVPPRDANSLATALQSYLNEPSLLPSQKVAALEKSRQFSLDRLAENLLTLEAEMDDGSKEVRSTEPGARSGERLKANSQP